jgi:hypothetical protein
MVVVALYLNNNNNKHAYASVNDCFAHLRALLVLHNTAALSYLYLIYNCLHCLLGEEDEEDERKEKDDKDDTDLEEREPDPEEWKRRYMDDQLGPDLDLAGMLSPSKMAAWQRDLDALNVAGFNASFGNKHLKENPPEVGDLVHVYSDKTVTPYHLNLAKPAKNPNALQAVPLGIVTQASKPFQHVYDDECDRPEDEPDIHLVAVRRLQDGDLGLHSLLYEDNRAIPISLFPKLCGDVIHDWPTPSGTQTIPTGLRKMTFGVPFADSTVFKKYGEGNVYLTAKSAPGPSVKNNNRLPEDDFARTVWSYEACMLFRLDDELLKQTSSEKGLAFANEANPKDGSGCLIHAPGTANLQV